MAICNSKLLVYQVLLYPNVKSPQLPWIAGGCSTGLFFLRTYDFRCHDCHCATENIMRYRGWLRNPAPVGNY